MFLILLINFFFFGGGGWGVGVGVGRGVGFYCFQFVEIWMNKINNKYLLLEKKSSERMEEQTERCVKLVFVKIR
jgi:hypothetical protein